MASGTARDFSEVSSLPEVVGGAAMLADPENVFDIARGISEVLLNDELRKELRSPSAVSVPRASVGAKPPRVLQLYEDICGNATARSNSGVLLQHDLAGQSPTWRLFGQVNP